MHIRTLTKIKPAPAADIEEALDIITYILNIFTQIINIATQLFGKEQETA